MNRNLQIAVTLTAIDKMSGVVNNAVGNALTSFGKYNAAITKIRDGNALIGAGKEVFGLLEGPVKQFAEFEKAGLRLKSTLLSKEGILNPDVWKRTYDEAVRLGNKLPGNTADFERMFTVMKNFGTDIETIVKGGGEAVASLANVTENSYEHTAEVFSKLKNAMVIPDEYSMQLVDTLQRSDAIGVKMDEMAMAMGRSSGAIKFLGLTGVDNFKKLDAAFGVFIKGGTGGYTTGTNFGRMMTNMMNGDKMKAVQKAASKFGINDFSFIDNKGQFAGIDNMMKQFTRLKGLSTQALSEILKPLTGLEGLDDQMAKTFSNGGVAMYLENIKKMDEQAGILQKQELMLTGVDAQWERLGGTLQNAKAAFGEAIKPALDKILVVLNNVAEAVQQFVQNNPKLAQLAAIIISVVGAGLMLAGVIKIIQGVIMILAMNPFILIVMAVIAAAVLIYTYWDDIVAFFKRSKDTLVAVFKIIWDWIKKVFSYTPLGLIINNWSKIKAFFTGLWEDIKKIFWDTVAWVLGLGPKFLEAGKNIVMSIWNGIKAVANKPVELIKGIVEKIRDYLPFSPAKVGALRDIHRIRLVETIAGNIKAKPLTDAMDMAMGGLRSNITGGSSAGGTQHYHFSPVITLSGGATHADANRLMEGMKPAMEKWWSEKMRDQQRRGY